DSWRVRDYGLQASCQRRAGLGRTGAMELRHNTWAAAGRGTLYPDSTTRLRAVRALASSGALAFCAVDDHVHGLWAWDPGEGAARASGVARALRAAATCDLQPGFARAVSSRRHLESVVDYLALQPRKH